MSLNTQIVVNRGNFTLNLAMSVSSGQTVALLGPNGAGKSTALRALAGLLPIGAGRITLNEQVLDDAESNTWLPPERRPVGVVFQDYLLFPHLSALDNVAFGLRARGTDRRIAHKHAADWLERVGLSQYAGSKPQELSGGQAQRVALARALATEPHMLLLDEPLAALDARTRMHVRTQLRAHLRDYDGATVMVTHDPLDATVLADYILVLEDGRVVQEGTPTEIAQRPRTNYVAELAGVNLYEGHSNGTTVQLRDGGTLAIAAPHTGEVLLAFTPTAVSLHRTKPAGSARNVWPVRVHGLEGRGHITRVQLTGDPNVLVDVTHAAVSDLELTPGESLWAELKATEIRTYPA